MARRKTLKNGIALTIEEAFEKAKLFKSQYPYGELEIIENESMGYFSITIYQLPL